MFNFFLTSFLSLTVSLAFNEPLPSQVGMQFHSDLKLLHSIKSKRSASPIHQEIFGQVDGNDYKDFFEYRISTVKMGNCGNPKAIACVSPFMSPRTIRLMDNYIKFKQPQIARLMVLLHEARHGEWWRMGWTHDVCPKPFIGKDGKPMVSIWTKAPLAGESACDSTAYGSYGAAIVFLKNIQKNCSNCSEKLRQDAGIFGDDQMGRIVDAGAFKEITRDLYSKK